MVLDVRNPSIQIIFQSLKAARPTWNYILFCPRSLPGIPISSHPGSGQALSALSGAPYVHNIFSRIFCSTLNLKLHFIFAKKSMQEENLSSKYFYFMSSFSSFVGSVRSSLPPQPFFTQLNGTALQQSIWNLDCYYCSFFFSLIYYCIKQCSCEQLVQETNQCNKLLTHAGGYPDSHS